METLKPEPKMKNRIANFFRTYHFINRQKQRDILDNDIRNILLQVRKPAGKYAIITDCPRKKTSEKNHKLIIIAKRNLLLTLFISENPQWYVEHSGVANFLFI